MESEGPPPDVISYNAMIYACRRERLEWALAFPDRMRAVGVPPDVITYNSVMQACGEANLWEHVLSGLFEMETQGIIPTIDSYYITVEKLVSAGQMAQALELVQSLTTRGLKMDEGCYNVLIIGALRAGSVEWAEYLRSQAEQQGAFERGSPNVLDLHRMTAMVARFFTLLELRKRAEADVKRAFTIVTGAGRHSEEAIIRPAIAALLQDLQLPARIASHGGSIKVDARELTPDLVRRVDSRLSAEELQREYESPAILDVLRT